MHLVVRNLITTVDKTGNQENTRQLGSGEEVGRNSTPETEEAIHTQIGHYKNNEESKEL